MSHDIEHTESLPEQAAYWWVVFHSEGVTPNDHREFGDWMARGPDRIAAYVRVASFHNSLKNRALHWPDTQAAELIRASKSAPTEAAPLHRSKPSQSERRDHPKLSTLRVASAFSVVCALALGAAWFSLKKPHQYQTAFGEQRSILLEDGSRITMNTRSLIETELGKHHRLVRMLRGEALFEVAHDPSRPFDVHAGNAVFRAVGTQFDVDRRPQKIIVTVVEGRVAVLPRDSRAMHKENFPTLGPADQVVVNLEGVPITLTHATSVRTAIAWTQRRLFFERRPAGEVADEFNRYNRAQIEVHSASLAKQEITGVFRSNDPASFISFLRNKPGVRVRADGRGRYIITLDEKADVQQVPALQPRVDRDGGADIQPQR